ncbi:MAG: DedA family protein [Candidatus Zixiibacteriota bacterium]
MVDHPGPIAEFVDQILRHGTLWVYLVLFAASFVENLFPPFPGDSFIAVAGLLSGVGRLEWPLAFACIVLGGMSSVAILYYFGRNQGRHYFERKNFKYFSVEHIRRVEQSFARWGFLILIVSRFLVGIRTAVAVVAGIGQYNTAKMMIFTTCSYILFVSLIMYTAGSVARNYDAIQDYFTTYGRLLWIVVIVIVAVVIYRAVAVKRKG